MTDSLDALWRAADEAPPPLSAEALRALKADAERLGRTLFWRDAREVGAAALAAAWFAFVASSSEAMRAPALGLVAVCLWIAAVLVAARIRAPRPEPDAAPRPAIASMHRWLSVQTALLRWAGLWYVLPSGLAIAGMTLARPDPSPIYLASVAVFALILTWLNVRASVPIAEARDRFAALLHSLDSPS